MCWEIYGVGVMDVVVVDVVRVSYFGSASLLVKDCRMPGGS